MRRLGIISEGNHGAPGLETLALLGESLLRWPGLDILLGENDVETPTCTYFMTP